MISKRYMELLDLERDDQDRFESRIAEAAEKASVSVDQETIRIYLKAKLKLPPRLQRIYDKFPHDKLAAQFGLAYGNEPLFVKDLTD